MSCSRAYRFREAFVVEGGRVCVALDAFFVNDRVDRVCRNSGLEVRGGNVENFSGELIE